MRERCDTFTVRFARVYGQPNAFSTTCKANPGRDGSCLASKAQNGLCSWDVVLTTLKALVVKRFVKKQLMNCMKHWWGNRHVDSKSDEFGGAELGPCCARFWYTFQSGTFIGSGHRHRKLRRPFIIKFFCLWGLPITFARVTLYG